MPEPNWRFSFATMGESQGAGTGPAGFAGAAGLGGAAVGFAAAAPGGCGAPGGVPAASAAAAGCSAAGCFCPSGGVGAGDLVSSGIAREDVCSPYPLNSEKTPSFTSP